MFFIKNVFTTGQHKNLIVQIVKGKLTKSFFKCNYKIAELGKSIIKNLIYSSKLKLNKIYL